MSSNGRRRSSKPRFYQADFETTTDPEDCRVWAWGLTRIHEDGTPITTGQVEIGTDVDDFLERMDAEDSVVYFHNLKWDVHFILDNIMKDGYEWVDERTLRPGQFTTLISDMGKFYSVKVRLRSGCQIEFRDSLKKIPMTVARMAEAFKMETLKDEIDYHEYRAPGHYPTPKERKYIENDVVIPATALQTQFAQGMEKLTVGSDALAEYKSVVGDKFFTSHFPVFPMSLDLELRRAYRGGFTYCDPRFSGRVVGGGCVFDVNSLYPAVMYNEPLPYGEPQFFENEPEPTASHPVTIFGILFTAKLKPNHIPCIQIKGNSIFQPNEYQSEIDEPTAMMVTNIDFELYQKHYDIVVHAYLGGWRFRAKVGMFKDYIDKWAAIKESSEGGLREIAKLFMNSLYGKFCSNPRVASKYPVLKDGKVVYRRLPDEIRDPVYTPVGVFITSYARALTVTAAQDSYDVFAYADTDSLHLMTDKVPDTLDIHATRMGAWKHEYDFDSAFYIRAKAYLERLSDSEFNLSKGLTPGDYVNRIAGLPEQISGALTFDDVQDGAVIEGKLTPKSVNGGLVLMDTPFRLKL